MSSGIRLSGSKPSGRSRNDSYDGVRLCVLDMTLIGIWRAFEPQTQRVRVIRRMGRRFASLTKGHHEQERMG
jgi:hypothetical protein